MTVADTSVAVAGALTWHEAHDAAAAALLPERTTLLGHVGIETYSVLTRLPPPQRVPAEVARAYLAKTFAFPALTLPAERYDGLLDLAARERITGGAVYDALVAATAQAAGAILLTLDRRALAAYERVGVRYELLA